MLVHKIIYILLLTILGLLVFYKRKPEKIEYFRNTANNFIQKNIIEKYSNNLTKSITCTKENVTNKTNETDIIQYINDNHELYQRNGAEKEFGIETSTKFTKNNINFERVAFFVHFNFLKNNSELKDSIMNQINSKYENKNILDTIENKLKNVIHKEGQFIYGHDFKNNYERVYLNYKEGNQKYYIDGYEWDSKHTNFKNYRSIENVSNIIKRLSELFSHQVAEMLLKIFPEDNWDVLLEKTDTDSSKSYYFSFKIDPILKNIYPQLKELLYHIHPDKETIDKWYECNKNNIVSWITLNLTGSGETEFNIYFISSDDNIQIFTETMVKLLHSRKILDTIVI